MGHLVGLLTPVCGLSAETGFSVLDPTSRFSLGVLLAHTEVENVGVP